jgi:hypothetical protein
VACLDGYPMSKQGRAGIALFMTTIASFVGASLGIVILTLFAPKLSEVALAFGPADYFAMMLLGLVAAATLAQGSPVKGIIMVLFGLCLGMVGTDVQTGMQRFTFDIPYLADGIGLVALAMGLFGVAEVIKSIGKVDSSAMTSQKITLPLDGADARRHAAGLEADAARHRASAPSSARCPARAAPSRRSCPMRWRSGSRRIPRASARARSRASRRRNRRTTRGADRLHPDADARHPRRRGDGADARRADHPGHPARAAADDGAPGDLLGPDRQLLDRQHPAGDPEHPADRAVGADAADPLLHPLPAILLFICIGVFSINNSYFDVLLVMAFGVLGYAMLLLRFEPAPLVLGFILGPLMEEHLRRAMLLSRGDPMVFLERPISASFLAVTALLLCWGMYATLRGRGTVAQPAPTPPQRPAGAGGG